jgi:hypothetical protein
MGGCNSRYGDDVATLPPDLSAEPPTVSALTSNSKLPAKKTAEPPSPYAIPRIRRNSDVPPPIAAISEPRAPPPRRASVSAAPPLDFDVFYAAAEIRPLKDSDLLPFKEQDVIFARISFDLDKTGAALRRREVGLDLPPPAVVEVVGAALGRHPPPSLPSALMRDVKANSFQLVKLIAGSLGGNAVFETRRLTDGVKFAVKFIPCRARDPFLFHAATREVRALLRAKGHPHVVNIECACLVGGYVCLFLEFCGGGTLSDALEGGDMRVIVRAAKEAAEGVAHLSRLGLVHRDIKPDNRGGGGGRR